MSECLVRNFLAILAGLVPIIFKMVQNSDIQVDKLGNKSYVLSFAGFVPVFVAAGLVTVICFLAMYYPAIEAKIAARGEQGVEADPSFG